MSLTISAAQVDALIANPSSITGYSSSGPIIITGAITHTQASNLNTVDATYIQATVSETTLANLANISVGNSTRSSLNKFSFTVSDTSSTATALSSAQAKTSVSVDASNVASITSSTSSSIQTLFTGTVPSGLGAVPITVSDTAPAATALEAINQFTTGKVTASATGLTGLAADVKAVLALADGVVQIAGNVNVVLTDTNIDAVDLNAVDAATTGTLTTSATTITGTGSAVNTALTSNASVAVNSIEGLDAVNAVLDDPSTTGTQAEAVAAVRLVMNKTTGKVTATISEGDVDSLTNATNGVTGTGHSLTMTVTDTGITAAELNALNATTTVNIVLDPAGTDNPIGVESSAYSDVLTAFQSSGLTGLSTAPVIVSGNISVAQANTLDALTSGSITATISNSSIAELNTLTGTGNAYSVVVGDITVNAADINSLVLKTTVAPTVNAVTTFTGTLDALNTFYVTNEAKVTNNAVNEAVTVTDSSIDADLLIAVNAKTSGDITIANATNVFGDSANVKLAFTSSVDNGPIVNQISGLDGNETVTLKGSSATNANLEILDALDLKSVADDTTGLVTIDSSVKELTGTKTEIQYALKQDTVGTGTVGVTTPTITGTEGLDITVDTGTLTIVEYLAIQNNYTTGAITAELEPSTYAALTAKVTGSTTVNQINSGNKFAVTVLDASLTAAKALELGAMTTGAIHLKPVGNMALTGTAAELGQIYGNAVNAKTKDGFLETHLNATTLTVTDAVVSAADMHTIADGTDGTKTVTAVTRMVGLQADIMGTYAKVGSFSGLGNENLTITDATLDASVFKTVIPDNAVTPTTGDITIIGSAVEGSLADLEAIFVGAGGLVAQHGTDHAGASVIGAAAINMTATDTSLSAANVKKLTNATTGVVTATIDNTVTTSESLATLIAASGLNQAAETIDSDFAGHNITVKLNDAEVTASGLKTLATLTKGNISLDTATTAGVQSPGLSGSIADVNNVYANSRISGLGGSALTITGGATVAEINALNTTGAITAAITDTDATTLAGLTGNATALAITLSDTTISATALDALDLKTTGQLNVASTTTVTGTLAELTATLAKTGTITGVGAVKAEVTGGSLTVAEANAFENLTTGKVKATIAEKDLATLKTLDTGNSWVVEVDRQVLDNPATTTTDETDLVIAAADLITLEGKTDQVVTVTAPTIDGSLADLTTVFDSNTPVVSGSVDLSVRTISGLETKAVTITDPSITQAEAITFQDNTSGVITATIGLNDFLTASSTTITQGTHNTVAALDNLSVLSHADFNAGVFTVTDAASGTGDISGGNGGGAAFTVEVGAAGGISGFDTGGETAADNGMETAVNGRTPGTYYIDPTNSSVTAADGSTVNAAAVGYRVKVVIANTTGNAVATLLAPGKGFANNDEIKIDKSVFGAAANNKDIILHVNNVVAKGISITQTAAGTGYTVNDTFSLASTLSNGTTTLGKALTFDVASVAVARPVSSAANGKYTVTSANFTSSSGGTGATIVVTVDADGYATTVTGSGGEGYEVGSTITVPDAQLGGGGASALVFQVTTVGKDSMSAVIAQTANAYDLKAGNHYDINIETAAVTAADVLAAKSLTTGLVTLSAGTTDITGSLADIKSIYALEKTATGTTGITGIANSTLDIRGDVGLLSAADLIALNADTTGLITITPAATSITGISGTLADVSAVLKQDKHIEDADNTSTDGVKVPTITGLLKAGGAVAAHNTVTTPNSATRTAGTYLIAATGGSGIGATFEVVVAANGNGTVTLKDKGSGYADTEVLTLSKTGAYGGTAADITVAINGIETAAPITVSVTDSITALELKALIESYNAVPNLAEGAAQGSIGAITATVSDTTMAKLAVIPGSVTSTGGGGSTENGIVGAYSITVSDAEVGATGINSLDSKTTTAITLSNSTITGALTTTLTDAVNAALASDGITTSGSLNVKSSDANNTIDEVNTASALTTGVVTATLTKADGTSLTLAELADLNDTGNAYTINVADTATVGAAALNVLNGKTTGVVTVNATKITGALSDIKSIYDANTAGEVAGLGNEVVSISDTGNISASTLNGLNGLTTGVVTVIGVTTVTGTLADLKAAYAANSAGTISGLGNEAISIADLGTVVSASDLTDIKALTTGNVSVSLSGSSVTATSLNSLDTSSTEIVNAAGVTTMTGTASDINTAYASAGITGLGNEAVTLTDTSIKASTLNTLNTNTTGTVDASTVKTITGSVADVNTVYATAGVTGGGDEAVTITDTTVSALSLNTLDGKTTGTINASTLTKLTGTSADVKTAFDATGISGLTFDASNYLASYTDLLAAYGSDLASSRAHYFAFGAEEGRSFDAFDETSYLASYSDLLGAFGTNVDSALVHYINNGYSEGRVADSFDENSYLASNTSLIGTVVDAASHYVNTGYAAGLALDSFDENSYLASNTSLIGTVTDATAHYVSTGYAAGLAADTFDELGYIASHSDLIAAYGVDGVAGTQHYITYGSTEGRTVSFDAASYLAAHADLRAAYGTDQELAKQHYIAFGSTEERALT